MSLAQESPSVLRSTDECLWLDELPPGAVVELTTRSQTTYRITLLEGAQVCKGYALLPATKIDGLKVTSSASVYLVTWPLRYVMGDRRVEVGRKWQFALGLRTDDVVDSFNVIE